MEFKSLHLRVDIAEKPKNHDNKRALFLGGLPFDITDEDVYNHFSNCGPIEAVRIIRYFFNSHHYFQDAYKLKFNFRDNKTGIGKGFGYVTFTTSDTVSLALKLDGKELKERKIRVKRCTNQDVF
jgi:nucleolar protein 12